MEAVTETIPGTPIVQADPTKSSFIQSALAAVQKPAPVNDKPTPTTVKTAPAKPAAEPAKEEPAAEEPKAESPKPKINLRKIAKGEPVEEVPAAAPDAKTEDVPAAIKSTKAAEEFKKLKAERDSLKAELAAAKGKPADDSTKTLLEQLQKERDEYSQRLKELDIERHPEFQAKFGKRIESLGNSIKATVGQKGDALLALLKLPDSEYKAAQVDGIIEELSPTQRTKLGGYIAQYEIAQQERQAEVEAAKGSWDQRKAQEALEAERAKLRDVEDVEQSWKTALLSATEFEPYQIDESDPESAQYVGQLVEGAKSLYMGMNNNQTMAKVALAAAAIQPMREALYAQLELNKRLAAENKRLKAASPTVTNQKPAEGQKKAGFIETVMAQVRR